MWVPCYADDIALLAPSPSALRIVLEICTRFADDHSLVFNAGKTQLIRFSLSVHPGTATFNFLGESLQLSKSIVHLGHILSQDLSDNEDIVAIKKDMCRKANYMLSVFSSCDRPTKTKLFQSYCLSLYGSSLWKSSCPELASLEVAFNNILRKIWLLPRQCHTAILHLVSNMHSVPSVAQRNSFPLLSLAHLSC